MSEGIKLTEDEIHPPGRLLRVARKDSLLCLSIVRWDISLALNMTYFLSPIGTSCHFAYAADAPLLSLSRHFPRFSGVIYPEGGRKICLCEEA